jgi:DNA-binding XRE family transcriptional regulator
MVVDRDSTRQEKVFEFDGAETSCAASYTYLQWASPKKERGMRNELKVARARRGVNQTIVANVLRISLNRYWRIESGVTDPTPAERARLARFFGLSERELFPPTEHGESPDGSLGATP